MKLDERQSLDEQIAVVVFGATVLHDNQEYLAWTMAMGGKAPRVGRYPCMVFPDDDDGRDIPNYSEDMTDAWLVIERMHALGWWCRLETPWTPDGQDNLAGFTPHGTTGWNGRPDHRAICATMPEAIGRAAIAAVKGGPHSLSEWPAEEDEEEQEQEQEHGSTAEGV